MFPPLGLFKDIPCPQGEQCSLLTCIFSHPSTNSTGDQKNTTAPEVHATHDPSIQDPPPPKKAKLQVAAEPSKGALESLPSSSRSQPTSQASSLASAARKPSQATDQKPVRLQTVTKKVSPPPPKSGLASNPPDGPSAEKPKAGFPPRHAPRESLNPRMLTKSPASHGVRLAILTKLHAAMSSLNNNMAKQKEGPEKYLVLSPNELITMALDEEESVAKDNASIYSNVIKLRIVKLSKMNQEDWVKEVKAHLNQRYYKIPPSRSEQKPKTLTTGLSVPEEIALAKKLVKPLEGLEQFGYVTKAPTNEEVENARKGVIESKGWEKCDRCGGRFQVFPGRREDGSLTTGGTCTYHSGKPVYPPRKPTDHITGPREAYFSCCNETLGTSPGCTKGQTHVYKVSETKRLASILQFERTPAQPGKGSQPPVCFDCEMGYTTLGLELIRMTAVSWPEGKPLVDVLVRPMGEVLDLNSRFSGVFPEHYTDAIPYGTTPPKTGSSTREDGEIEPAPLHVVESPAAARALLFQLIQPDTPLIGHAIDNDLNACRIIHPAVIDTVLLYPHPRGLPIRTSLKMGGDRGHDSKEDAVATGDLVRSKGWVLQDDRLVPPRGTPDDAAGDMRLGRGAGQKRTSSG
ncbi:putative RNA exonuclease Rex3 [Aspergillus steynii IBT 23096]|uniref:Putative RNA exonuclease Rex3 n=1 Tax=Aspergillus steynii IBT 23096 TaxID=1392250 RepID=A0A2I2GJV2_9EURO|nr:putative RNA exonuclease Rex3 [Aspergillus steynii IBT 23096]PLB53152.1 putative RNA exonuclease Rex3 [Aspergillus steynii IBT 23096]